MSVIVSCARGHNSSTTLMVDGEIVFYLEEEIKVEKKFQLKNKCQQFCLKQ